MTHAVSTSRPGMTLLVEFPPLWYSPRPFLERRHVTWPL